MYGVGPSTGEGHDMHISRPIASRRCHAAALAAVVICSTAFTGPVHAPAGGAPSPSVPAPQLDWKPCVKGSPFDCATAKVPLDYDDAGGRTIELAVVKRKATGSGQRIGTLFFNPGGPGGPGTVQMPQNYESFPREVRERFDIVSWDPRGIGNSTAVNCFASPEEAADWAASKAAGFPVGEKERAAFAAAYAELGRRCEQRAPELLRHVSTAENARDLDQLRKAVGEQQLTYYGISYGTYLGATYANLFPGRVRAMVFDANWDPRAWTNNASDDGRPDHVVPAPGLRPQRRGDREPVPRVVRIHDDRPLRVLRRQPEGDPGQVRPAAAAAPKGTRGPVDLRRHRG